MSFSVRPEADIKPARKSAGYRHAWELEFDRIDRREGAPKVGALGDIGHVG